MKENEKELNYIVVQNNIVAVEKITQKDIESGGKFNSGFDIRVGKNINILDKDYGKSAELMRALIEEENIGNNKWKRVIIGIISFIILLIIGGIIMNGNTNKIKENNYIKNVEQPKIKVEQPKEIQPPKIKVEQPKKIQPPKKIQNNNELDIEYFKTKYELEKLQIKYGTLKEEKSNLLLENINLKENNKNLTLELEKYSKKAKNLTQEAFLLFLGQEVYKRCENTINIEVKSNCKDLYFNYVKND